MAGSPVSAKSFFFRGFHYPMMQTFEKQDVERELPGRFIRSGTGMAANLSEAVYGSSRRTSFSKPALP